LSNLLEPEVSFEGTLSNARHQRLVAASPNVYQNFGATTPIVPSFASFAIPHGRATLSGFANSEQRYVERFQFAGRFCPEQCEDGSFGSIDVAAWNVGVGGAYLLTPKLSVGASAVVTRLRLETAGSSGTPEARRNGTETNGTAVAASFFAGALYKPHPRVGLGVAYYRGATFHLTTHITGTFFGFDQPLDVWRPIDYVLPDRLSAGGSLRIGRAITVVGEAAHVNYSKMIGPNFQVVDFMAPSVGFSRANYFYRDVTEAHAGVEYRLVTRGHVVALRAGAFTDPEHRLHFIPQGQDRHIDNAQDLRFNTTPDRTRIGVTAGAGLTFNNKFQIDIAGTFVADARHLIVSVVRRLN